LKRTTKRSRAQSGAAIKQHDADEQDSIENSFSSGSSKEEASIQFGGRLEALATDLDEVQAGLGGGLTRKESMEKRQPHLADRVRHYVKSIIFRRIKFVNSDQMSHKALQLVIHSF
jgi:hypothetical protein